MAVRCSEVAVLSTHRVSQNPRAVISLKIKAAVGAAAGFLDIPP
eukprot:CAMPEP_0183821966 /NCGR_PEP_ID=MMETSP0803_2-20130417/65406_1 /TAXON_ID=195967 /ORGANISM="Crustomastix stigmata, Strain CCMP3273" /LENGTH=43 /DNA_ID= /DNA_START= /DNA_END= /DNA_ORIENTATION=